MTRMGKLMARLGLEVNTTKTRIARLPEEQFDFLGYTVGRFHGKDGRPYFGTRPSRKAVKSLLRRIHERTTRQWYPDEPVSTVARISSMIRGWCGYFDQGPVMEIYELVRAYTERRVRRWLMRRSRTTRRWVPPDPKRVSLRDTRPLQRSTATRRPAESEGLTGREKAGCGKSACPV